MTCSLILGCGSGPKSVASKPEPMVVPPSLSNALTGPVVLEQRNEKLNRQWTISAKSSRMMFDGPNKMHGDMSGVTGSLFENDAVSSQFSATEAKADQAKSTLDLKGNVLLTSEKHKLTIRADSVSWLPDRKLIEAKGHVMLDGKDFVIGPFERLLATPDLRQTGTPDTFTKLGPPRQPEKR